MSANQTDYYRQTNRPEFTYTEIIMNPPEYITICKMTIIMIIITDKCDIKVKQ